MLDRHVQRFLDSEACSASGEKTSSKGGFGVGLKTVGVRVQCRKGGEEIGEEKGFKEREGVEEGDGVDSDERDENNGDMIWWSWDGKLTGFLD